MKKLFNIILFLVCSTFSVSITKPEALKKGDKVGIIAPANFVSNREKADVMIKELESMGFEVVLGKSFNDYWFNFGGIDNVRAEDINEMFANKEIKGIFCVRGGYGSIRLLDKINYDIVKDNPKVFVGLSDITTLHIAFNEKADLVTYHGPMYDHIGKDLDSYTKNSLLEAIQNGTSNYKIYNPQGNELKTYVNGVAEGEVIGGNLSLVVASLGTDYEINTKDKILFLEEVGEDTYRIDRLLQQLKLAGKIDDAKGIILGSFTKITKDADEDFSLEDVLKYNFENLDKPVIMNFSSGHTRPLATLPLGSVIKIDSSKDYIEVVDGSVQ